MGLKASSSFKSQRSTTRTRWGLIDDRVHASRDADQRGPLRLRREPSGVTRKKYGDDSSSVRAASAASGSLRTTGPNSDVVE
jgi:hypothetical protein